MQYSEINPCLICGRVRDPESCDNKNCIPWQQWFLRRWDYIHSYIRRQKDGPAQTEGIVIGGVRYATPHLVRDYLKKDPCDTCSCDSNLCPTPCRARQTWAKIQREC